MFRAQILTGIFLIFGLFGVVSYAQLSGHNNTQVRSLLRERLNSAYHSMKAIQLLRNQALLERGQRLAQDQELISFLLKGGEATEADEAEAAGSESEDPLSSDPRFRLHLQLFDKILRTKNTWAAKATGELKPSLERWDLPRESKDIIVTDARGLGLARLSNQAWYGVEGEALTDKFSASQIERIQLALKERRAFFDLWEINQSRERVALVPVVDEGNLLGLVIICDTVLEQDVKSDRRMLGADVAYFFRDQLFDNSSLSIEEQRSLSERLGELRIEIRDNMMPAELPLGGKKYLVRAGFFKGYHLSEGVGFVVAMPLGEYLGSGQGVLLTTYLLLFLAIILMTLFFYSRYQNYIRPFAEIEEGVLRLIDKELDYWFDASDNGLSGSLSNHLNIMVCQLTGRPLPEELQEKEDEI